MSREVLIETGAPQSRGNILSEQLRRVKKYLLGEATGEKRDRTQDLTAGYLGIVLGNAVGTSRMSKEEALAKIAEFGEVGLPIEHTNRSFKYYVTRGITVPWLDLDFQRNSLEKYLPELIEEQK